MLGRIDAAAALDATTNTSFALAAAAITANAANSEAFALTDARELVRISVDVRPNWKFEVVARHIPIRPRLAPVIWRDERNLRRNVFARGDDDTLQETWFDGSRWLHKTVELQPALKLTSAPVAGAYFAKLPQVFGEPELYKTFIVTLFGTTQGLYEHFWNGHRWAQGPLPEIPAAWGVIDPKTLEPHALVVVGLAKPRVHVFTVAKTQAHPNGEILELRGVDLHWRNLCDGTGWTWYRRGMPSDAQLPSRVAATVWHYEEAAFAMTAFSGGRRPENERLYVNVESQGWTDFGRARLVDRDTGVVVLSDIPGGLARIQGEFVGWSDVVFAVVHAQAQGMGNELVGYFLQQPGAVPTQVFHRWEDPPGSGRYRSIQGTVAVGFYDSVGPRLLGRDGNDFIGFHRGPYPGQARNAHPGENDTFRRFPQP